MHGPTFSACISSLPACLLVLAGVCGRPDSMQHMTRTPPLGIIMDTASGTGSHSVAAGLRAKHASGHQAVIAATSIRRDSGDMLMSVMMGTTCMPGQSAAAHTHWLICVTVITVKVNSSHIWVRV